MIRSTATTAQSATEVEVRAFALAFPTAAVHNMVQLCVDGRITWEQAAELARKATAAALVEAQA